jgi:spermidine dehydrogenase
MSKRPSSELDGPDRGMTRRDFMGTALLGAGSALLSTPAPAQNSAAHAASKLPYAQLGADWTGPGGIGDYAASNGNVAATVNTAHALRDGRWQNEAGALLEPDEVFDLIVVGGGISGLTSSYEFLKLRGQRAKVLLLDNHPIFGGEAKQNELDIDGYRLQAPQGSNMFLWPPKKVATLSNFYHPVWEEIGLPMEDGPGSPEWITTPTGTTKDLALSKDNYTPMMVGRERSQQMQFFVDPRRPDKWIGVKNPWADGYAAFPWPEAAKKELVKLDSFVLPSPPKDLERWLDTMTYREYLTQHVGITSREVFDYLNPMIAAYGTGLGCDVISALTAFNFRAPGFLANPQRGPRSGGTRPLLEPVSFPGGNAAIARHLVKRLIPDAIAGKADLHDIIYGEVNWSALDRVGQSLRMRLATTAVDVRHEGAVDSAKQVSVIYIDSRTGKPQKARGKTVVMAGGQWMNKHVIRDAPPPVQAAMDDFNHAPMLVINVGVRNWRFMEKLGIGSARWLGGLGWFTNVRAPMSINGQQAPLDPDQPAILTFYNSYICLAPGLGSADIPLKAQCVAARSVLYSLSYKDIESKIRAQLAGAFGHVGFDHQRDIAGLITNRWGHAYVVPQPGFFYGRSGAPAPRETLRQGYGRIRFSHSELTGDQIWSTACAEGERAARQAHDLA